MNDVSIVLDQRKGYYLTRLREGVQQKRAAKLLDVGAKANAPQAPTSTSKGTIGTGTKFEQRNVIRSSQTTSVSPTSLDAPRVTAAASSIETSVITNNTSIEIPPEIDALIDNKAYRNKFKSLIRKGYLPDLLDLAEIALTKDRPSHWFAKVTKTTPALGQDGPTMWERTLKYLAKLRNIRRVAELVAAKIGTAVTKGIYKQIWRGANVERWADTAAEMKQLAGQKAGKRTIRKDTDPAKYFMWLCGRELAAREGNTM